MHAVRVLDSVEHKSTFPKISSQCLKCHDLSMGSLSAFKHSFRHLLMSINTFLSMIPPYMPFLPRNSSNFFTSWSTKTSIFELHPHLVISLEEGLIHRLLWKVIQLLNRSFPDNDVFQTASIQTSKNTPFLGEAARSRYRKSSNVERAWLNLLQCSWRRSP
ncbi:hypothetical protein XPA_006800 [Xanthoria parietina]